MYYLEAMADWTISFECNPCQNYNKNLVTTQIKLSQKYVNKL